MLDIAAKCRTLLLLRLHAQGTHVGTVMGAWFSTWDLHRQPPNPPNAAAYPTAQPYVRAYATDMAYVTPSRPDEGPKAHLKRIYDTLHFMAITENPTRNIRIETLNPTYDLPRICHNLHTTWIIEAIRSTWYLAIHDMIPTKQRLHRIALTDTDQCVQCGQPDTLPHRLTKFSTAKNMWQWTRERLAAIFHTDPHHIPSDWPLKPYFRIQPPL
jgi:hypothetical protein